MEHNWVNISAIAGFYVSIAVIINNFFKSKKAILRTVFMKKYRKVLTREMIKQGVIMNLKQ